MLSGEVLISGGTNWDLIGRSQLPKGGEDKTTGIKCIMGNIIDRHSYPENNTLIA